MEAATSGKGQALLITLEPFLRLQSHREAVGRTEVRHALHLKKLQGTTQEHVYFLSKQIFFLSILARVQSPEQHKWALGHLNLAIMSVLRNSS